MGKILNIIPVSDLRQNAAKILKQLKDSNEPFIITQRGRATAVMQSVETFEQSEHDKKLLRLLVKGERELEIGEGYDLEAVLDEADLILSGKSS